MKEKQAGFEKIQGTNRKKLWKSKSTDLKKKEHCFVLFLVVMRIWRSAVVYITCLFHALSRISPWLLQSKMLVV